MITVEPLISEPQGTKPWSENTKKPISIFVEQAYKIHCNLVLVEKPEKNSNCVKLSLLRRNPTPPLPGCVEFTFEEVR